MFSLGPLGNIAVGKPTGQSTYNTWMGQKLQGWRAVEGNRKAVITNTNAFCFASHPTEENNAYMYVDLENMYFIQSLSILLRKGLSKYGNTLFKHFY